MTVGSVATAQTKKIMKLGLSLFRRGFNASKCKTAAKMAVARIKLLKNKREVVVKQMKRDIALLLQSGQDATARIRVEHVIREQNVLTANEFIELFCELIVARLTIISKQRECPADLKEGIASLIFAAPRCSEIPELLALRDTFEKKYGRDFVSAATDLRPNAGVNRMLIDKLSVRTPTGEVKLKVMKDIAKEFQIEWDTTESEKELLDPSEELIKGPPTFVSASSLPLNPPHGQSVEPKLTTTRSTGFKRDVTTTHYEDTASAAEAAAESARTAVAAAQAAAYLANKDGKQYIQADGKDENLNYSSISPNSYADPFPPNGSSINNHHMNHQSGPTRRIHESQSFQRSYYRDDEETRNPTNNIRTGQACRRHSYNPPSRNSDNPLDDEENEMEEVRRSNKGCRRHSSYNARPSVNSDVKFDEPLYDEEMETEEGPTDLNNYRRHSYNARSDIKFDESDYDEEIEAEEAPGRETLPPKRPPPALPFSQAKQSPNHRVHPKLPDYDTLAARFESLKYREPKD